MSAGKVVRKRPTLSLSLSDEAHRLLDAIAKRYGGNRSLTVEILVRSHAMDERQRKAEYDERMRGGLP